MWLRELQADRLRNLKAVSLTLSPGLTVVAGRNAQGKSSLLEAVYLLGTGRSFRTRKADELVNWDGGPLRVQGMVEARRGQGTLTVVMDRGERRLLADGIERELDEFIGRLDVVDLTAERMRVLRGGPEDRRRFLDRGVVGVRPSFLRALGEYRRVLQQRNALVRRLGAPGRRGGDELDAWDERLVAAATEVHRGRREYAVRLAGFLGEPTRALFPGGRELVLAYRPSPAAARDADLTDFPRIFAESLREGRSRDLEIGHTCQGPHRDELLVRLDEMDLRKYGSAGQVRASMIVLKLGKLALLKDDRGEDPLFLMDDFDSDIDETRAAALAGSLHGGGFQALVATSKVDMADRLGVSFTKLTMDDGSIRD